MTEDAHIESHDEPIEHAPAAATTPAAQPDVHPSLVKHVMSAQQAQAAAEAAVLEHDKKSAKTIADKLAEDGRDAKAKLLSRLQQRHNERFSHSVTKEESGGITIHSFVMFGGKRVATARYLTPAELEKTSEDDLVAHEAMQLHTLAALTGA